jgi:hypothetical protein
MLLPGYASIIDRDHKYLWAWEAELLLSIHGGWPRREADPEFRKALELVVHALLAGHSYPTDGSDEWMGKNRLLRSLLNEPANELLAHLPDLVAYLGLPVLEGLLKRRAAAYVTTSGVVLAPFQVPGRSYDPAGGRQGSKKISSLRDLLWLEHQNCGSLLRTDIDDLIEALPQLQPGLPSHGFDVMYEWRNSSLHGDAANGVIGATMLSLILRIVMDELDGEYDAYKLKIVSGLQFRAAHGVGRGGWQYYPPEGTW